MTLADFKRKHRYTQVELAEIFGVSHRSICYYLKDEDMRVKGRAGSRVIVKEKVVARERPLEPFDG